ncbi:MAG: hypothetical protein GTN49_11370 [candidate division Zixibacteria bacterium]|nr:hypothetical protein [candidate division Zixibacteria bacterium]
MKRGKGSEGRGGSSRRRTSMLPRLARWAGVGVFVFSAAYGDTYVYWYKWGTRGPGNGQFEGPYDVTVAPNGRVYVVDWGNNRVQYFALTGEYLGQWGTLGSGDGQFNEPVGIAAGPDSTIYVTEKVNNRVQYFTADGSFLGKWGKSGAGDGEFKYPFSIAISPDYGVYVADSFNYRIQRFSKDGSFLNKWGTYGGGDGQFRFPEGVATAPSGNVYVIDYMRCDVQYFTRAGSFLGKFGRKGPGPCEFSGPTGVHVASNNEGSDDFEYVGFIFCSKKQGYEFTDGRRNIIVPMYWRSGIIYPEDIVTRDEVDANIDDYRLPIEWEIVEEWAEFWKRKFGEYGLE